jgi:hypothetical protein
MNDEDLLDFLLARWDRTAQKDRVKVWRELLGEISASFRGKPGKAAFLGSFIGSAHFDDDEERRQLLAVARRTMEDGDVDDDPDQDDDCEDRPVASKDLKAKRKKAVEERDALLKEFNVRYAVVRDGGTALVFDDCYDDGLKRRFYDRLKPSALGTLYASRKICTRIDDDGKRHFQPVAKWWLNHEKRREFVNGTVFKPGGEARAGFLNLWQGFGHDPKPGSWEKMRSHMQNVICGGNASYYDYLVGWMARAIQQPSARGEVAIVLRGETRIGKGMLGHALRELFGQHGLHISSSKHLVGNFNVHLRDCVYLFADEAFFAGDKANVSTLKALITEPVLTIEAKYLNAVQCNNNLHILMASNDDWVIPAGLDEARFFVLDVSPERKGDHEYFKAIAAEMENGGYGAMLHELMKYDLEGFNVWDVPKTEALQDQKQYSLGTTFAWLREVIERGFVYQSKLGLEDELHQWWETISFQLIHASYADYANSRGERHPLHQTALIAFLRNKMGWRPTQPRQYTIIVGEHLRGREPAVVYTKARPRCLNVGTLSGAHETFFRATGLSILSDDDFPEPVAAE